MRRVLSFFPRLAIVALAIVAAQPAAVRADVVAAYELTDPAVVPGGGVVSVVQGAPGQPLEITLDDTPGDHTIKIIFAADVEAATALIAYALELTTTSTTVSATALDYLGVFDYQLDPPILTLSAGPGAIVDEAVQGTFLAPQSGMMDLFEVTLVVTVPTADIEIFSVIGDAEWASIADPFTIAIGDSDPLDSAPGGQISSTPSIIIRTFVAPPMDCNTNTIPDADEITGQPSLDCNTNGTLDSCEIAGQPSLDCNTNATLDSCEIALGASDCNSNGIIDSCDIAAGTPDCNANSVPDSCEIITGTSTDCDSNGVPDSCEIASGAAGDCNTNGRPDRCDIAGGQSSDTNANGVPDECETVNPTTPPRNPSAQETHVVDRQSLKTFLALILGIPGEGGLSLSGLPIQFFGPIGIPLSILLGGLEFVNYPTRILIFQFIYSIFDAILP